MSEQTIYDWFQFVASRVNIGIWMFDAEYAGFGLSPELIARIADIENICGIKIPRPLEKYEQVQKLIRDKIVMSEPTEGQFLKLIRDYGQKVHQSSPTPYLYQTPGSTPMHDYTELALSGKFAEAETISSTLQPVREVAARWMRAKWVDQNLIPIAYIKAWSEMLGMAGGPVRPGLPQITETERAELRQALERTGLLRSAPIAKAA
jgi:4-hydroxy-tetrahydrodipicolinate synthase